MPAASCRIPTTPWARRPSFGRRAPNACLRAGRFFVGLLTCLFLAGCESAPQTHEPHAGPPPVAFSGQQLARNAKLDFQLCLSAFYEDKWETVGKLADRLRELGERWQSLPAPPGKEKEYAEHAGGFLAYAGKLVESARVKDADATTAALRGLAGHLTALQAMQ